jgi:trans-aconitate 2-methyltransferase
LTNARRRFILVARNKMNLETYNWNAEEYLEASSEQQKWAAELIEKLRLKGDENLLDIGCGDGRVTAEIARRLPDGGAIGVDASENMIVFARRRYGPEKYPNLKFQIEDARALPFQNEFDIVFSNAALHWVREHLSVLEGIRNALKPGGRTLLQMGGAGNAAAVLAVFDSMIEINEWKEYFLDFIFPFAFYSVSEYQELLEKVGLKSVRVELKPKDMTHGGAEGLAQWISATWLPFVERVPEEKRKQFVAEFVRRYIEKHPPDEHNFVHVPMIRLEIEALKP